MHHDITKTQTNTKNSKSPRKEYGVVYLYQDILIKQLDMNERNIHTINSYLDVM